MCLSTVRSFPLEQQALVHTQIITSPCPGPVEIPHTTYRDQTCHSSCTNTLTDSISLSIFTYLMSKHIREHSNQISVDLG